MADLVDPPGGSAEDDGVAFVRLENHFFVEFADAGALARRQVSGDAVPGEARAKFGEFVGRIAAGKKIEKIFEGGAR